MEPFLTSTNPYPCYVSSILTCSIRFGLYVAIIKGLIEAASNSQALVLVDGFDTKPARNISKRLWMHQLRSCMRASKDETIAWAAIVSWGDVNDREMLECQYTCDTMGDFIRPLNRYHNLFLMVDDGLRYMHPNSKIRQFRLRLEQALSDRLRESSGSQDNLSRCSIAVLVGGDYKSLLEIEARVNAGMPCVVCIGTGMAADILYLACQLSETDSDKRLTMSAYLRRRLAARLSRLSDAPDDTDEAIGLISRLVSNNKLLKFCNTLNGASFAEEILKPLLLFANSPTAVARLAKLWNRPDILQSVFAKDQNALDQLNEADFDDSLQKILLMRGDAALSRRRGPIIEDTQPNFHDNLAQLLADCLFTALT
ncbi:unnamed protein product [Schistocephalus solidus]|uniref:LSDAT_euk domain-containing protein n=1 Tax=Schistocephalus solidus TaxID=70667 RepID=A0A183TBG6_SCHSO|nr:unnamed protein product [Schistocephalus solidus]